MSISSWTWCVPLGFKNFKELVRCNNWENSARIKFLSRSDFNFFWNLKASILVSKFRTKINFRGTPVSCKMMMIAVMLEKSLRGRSFRRPIVPFRSSCWFYDINIKHKKVLYRTLVGQTGPDSYRDEPVTSALSKQRSKPTELTFHMSGRTRDRCFVKAAL